MNNREFNEKRTMLANAFATAGAELLEYMGVSSALAAIPNTEPQQYVVAGTLQMIAKALPGASQAAPASPEQVQAERARFEAWGNEHFNYGFEPEERVNGLDDSEYKHEGTQMAWEGWQARAYLAAPIAAAPAAPSELPAILFDGKAVYDEITHHVGKCHCFASAAVAAALDAVVLLMRKEGVAPAAPEQDEVRNQAQVDVIMEAINHACGKLPAGYEVILEMENGAGGVVWTDDEGERHVIDGEGYISQDIHEAVRCAIEHASMKTATNEGEAK